jgi:nitrile hydratase accessory protein
LNARDALDLRNLVAPEEVTFAEPWQAQAYAIAYELRRAGVFTWEEWTHAFGARLKAHPDPDEYYLAWVETIEALVVAKGAASLDRLVALKGAWQEAYETTPHGKPVELPAGA